MNGIATETDRTATIKSVSIKTLFVFSTFRDKCLIVFGSICAIGFGQRILAMASIFSHLLSTLSSLDATVKYITLIKPDNNNNDSNNTLQHPQSEQESSVHDLISNSFKMTSIYIALALLALSTLYYGMVIAFEVTARNQTNRALNMYIESLVHQDMEFFDKKETRNLVNQTAEDFQKFHDAIGVKFSDIINCVSGIIVAFIYSFYLGWKLTLVCLCFTPLYLISYKILTTSRTKYSKLESFEYCKASAIAEEVLGAIRTVVAFGGETIESQRYATKLENVTKAGYAKGIAATLGTTLLYVATCASFALSTWFALYLCVNNLASNSRSWNIYVMITTINVLNSSVLRSWDIFASVDALFAARISTARILNLIQQKPSINCSDVNLIMPLRDTEIHEITFDNVSFSYPNRQDVKAIDGFNLTVQSGETIALVGGTGSGKSTIISLLLRFYDVSLGKITLDGKDLRNFDVRWLRQQIGLVGQEPVLFPSTIEENISYGKLGVVGQTEIENAARMANAHDFIQKLPMKYKTLVGDRGSHVSGGQKQRIAIARALIRNPRILILDEATSALDTQSEALVQDALIKAREGRTTIIIAHRLSTIRHADRIIVVSSGKIAEMGTHEELINLNGIYCKLVTTQSFTSDTNTSSETEAAVQEGNVKANQSKLRKNSSAADAYRRLSIMISNKIEFYGNPLRRLFKLGFFEAFFVLVGMFGSILNSFVYTLFYTETFGFLYEILHGYDHLSDNKTNTALQEYIYFTIICAIAYIVAITLQMGFLGIASSRLARKLRKNLFESLIRKDMAFFDNSQNNIGGLCLLLSLDVENVKNAVSVHLGMLLNAVTKFVSSIAILSVFSWKLGVAQLCLLIIGFVITIGMKKLQLQKTKQKANALSASNEVLRQILTNVWTVASFGLEDEFHEKFMCNYNTDRFAKWKNCVLPMMQTCIELWAQLGVLIVIVLSAPLIFDQDITILNIIRSIGTLFATTNLSSALALLPNFIAARNSLDKIFKMIDNKPKTDPTISELFEEVTPMQEANVEFRDISFKYPMRQSVSILKEFTLSIKTGQTVALVGGSGSGKSTCLQLLERFYEPYYGSISLNGKSIKSMDKCSLRRQMVIVQQEPALFDRSIAENIAYGDNTRQVTMDEIVKAAIIAQAHQFIVKLPQGYETLVGQRGAQLSGGQKQRIAIARALVRKSRIVLLDEATSALDTETEKEVQRSLKENMSGATFIVVAHRLSTIADADVIAVVHDGKVVELGTHLELLALGGHYHNLYLTQS